MKLVLRTQVSNVLMLCCVSAAALSLVAAIVARQSESNRHQVNIGVCYIGIGEPCGEESILFFNNLKYGPHPDYMSVTTTGQGFSLYPNLYRTASARAYAGYVKDPTWKRTSRDSFGVVYTCYQRAGSPPIWGISISLEYPMLMGLTVGIGCRFQLIFRNLHRGFEVIPAAK